MIRYEFKLEQGDDFVFEVDTEAPRARAEAGAAPDWTRLEVHQCRNCPLDPESDPHCPVAVDVAHIAERFGDRRSIERCEVTVRTPARSLSKETDLQSGLNSLLGLVMATSACPVLSRFKGMAATHLPFSTVDETIYRSLAAHLVQLYLTRPPEAAEAIDLEEMRKTYDAVQFINSDFVKRLKTVIVEDATLNAVVTFFNISYLVRSEIDQNFASLRRQFQ